MHGDHIFGLPGLLCAISACRSETYKQKDEKKKRNGNNGRGPRDAFKDQEPLVITGPPGLKAFVHAAMTYSRTQLGDGYYRHGIDHAVERKSLRSATVRSRRTSR